MADISKLRILGLHGNCQCAEIMDQQTAKIQKKLNEIATFTFLDAPFELPLKEDDDVPMRTWYQKEHEISAEAPAESVAAVRALWEEEGPFHGLLCFSQGCMFAVHLALLGELPIQFIVFYGGLAPRHISKGGPIPIPTLHYYGDRDKIVPKKKSQKLAKLFLNPEVYKHKGSHVIAKKKGAIDKLAEFLQRHFNRTFPNSNEAALAEKVILDTGQEDTNAELRAEELESLQSLFTEEEMKVRRGSPTALEIAFLEPDLVELMKARSSVGQLSLRVTWGRNYPSEPCKCSMKEVGNILKVEQIKQIEELCLEEARATLGDMQTYSVFVGASELVRLFLESKEEEDESPFCGAFKLEVKDPKYEQEIILKAEDEALSWKAKHPDHVSLIQSQKGHWTYTVGLVGKPSAGKSTFFNAVCDPIDENSQAKVGAFPFTTIEPNFGQGCYETAILGELREVPILLKDVAGLVPGAYEGRGMGNKFLDDLLDADVLIHICDGSGQSDRDGNKGNKGDPVDDVAWVGEEIHKWVYSNLKRKWYSVVRRPDRLPQMFTGYHCTKDFIEEALSRMPDAPRDYAQWDARHVHRLISHFVAIRFPTLLCMNKLDIKGCAENIPRVKEKYPYCAIVPASANHEWNLCQWQRKGFVKYDRQNSHIQWISNDEIREEVERYNAFFECARKVHKVSGVMHAINAAVKLRPPLEMFPVSDLDTCEALSGKGRLHDCILMKPASRVIDLYQVLTHRPVSLLVGTYIRAESKSAEGKENKVLRKNERLSRDICIIRILTNKKRTHQQRGDK